MAVAEIPYTRQSDADPRHLNPRLCQPAVQVQANRMELSVRTDERA